MENAESNALYDPFEIRIAPHAISFAVVQKGHVDIAVVKSLVLPMQCGLCLS
jgi:hypothetical protein